MADPTPSDDLKAADERRVVLAGRQWRARSRRVMLLRRVLPLIIAVLAGGTALWVGTRSIIAGVERSRVESREVRLSNPMFHGQDEQGRSFVIGAAQAVRDPDTGMFRLDAPVMRLTLEAGKTSELSAGHGLYDEPSRTLILRGQVIIEDGGAGFASSRPRPLWTRAPASSPATRASRASAPLEQSTRRPMPSTNRAVGSCSAARAMIRSGPRSTPAGPDRES
ncbi:LPS export ABC transporter periplasmic protein LptC [Brevundimonas denitrificans]|uniref:LPS export ABC transporter periplasmic protein LptC n=1 Tax=Brevundimonas denitrificans TaxID=1443434 RepID=UPI00223B7F19|nr:LPS export ABC transporter periplasmic protein LptC [Brevundimonas denitrificans]